MNTTLLLAFLPQTLANAAPFAYITNYSGSTVSVIDVATNTVITKIPVPFLPYGVAVSPNGTRAYVTSEYAHGDAGALSVIDTATNTVLETVRVGVAPYGVAVNPAGTRVYVANSVGQWSALRSMSIIETATNTVVDTVELQGASVAPITVVVHPSGTPVYAINLGLFGTANPSVWVINPATNQVTATITGTLNRPFGAAIHPSGAFLYVADFNNDQGESSLVAVIDTTAHIITYVTVLGAPLGVAVHPDGTRLYVGTRNPSTVHVINTQDNTVAAVIPVGTQPFDTEGMALTQDGKRLYVTNPVSSTVTVIDTVTNSVVATVPVEGGANAFGQFIVPSPVLTEFCATGSMNVARFNHTATLLPSGKVLVAGGLNSFTSSVLASAELYDPLTGSWTPTGSMNTPRHTHTATLLSNGKVLVVGGDSSRGELGVPEPSNFLASVELYDPSTGIWSLTGSTSTPHKGHTATPLPSGKVLVAGGRSSASTITPGAELYDPATETFAPTGSMNAARGGHTATLLLDSRVLVAGGNDTHSHLSSVELYDPGSGTWAFTGSLSSVRRAHGAPRLNDGRVLVVGGEDGSQTLRTAELYDPETGAFGAVGPLITGRASSAPILLSDGTVLVSGGNTSAGEILSSAEIYDLATRTWSATASMKTARYVHTATLLLTGEVLVAGGFNGPGSLASAELFTSSCPNNPPTVGAITAPIAPVQVNTLISTSASFNDLDTSDTHTAVWNWGDGATSAGTVTETNGSGSVNGSHTYTAPGVYTVTLTVTDDDGGLGQSVFQFVVVYDPNAGFVTGGGWINSPVGAYTADPSLTGKANFGFVSRYRPGATVPEGQTEFRFSVANLNFHSSNYEWLVVGGARAQYKGTGTINGSGSYNFILTAIDGQVAGGGGVDKFRIKIWGSGVIYDNQMEAGDDANPTTVLGGGSIVIHTQ